MSLFPESCQGRGTDSLRLQPPGVPVPGPVGLWVRPRTGEHVKPCSVALPVLHEEASCGVGVLAFWEGLPVLRLGRELPKVLCDQDSKAPPGGRARRDGRGAWGQAWRSSAAVTLLTMGPGTSDFPLLVSVSSSVRPVIPASQVRSDGSMGCCLGSAVHRAQHSGNSQCGFEGYSVASWSSA